MAYPVNAEKPPGKSLPSGGIICTFLCFSLVKYTILVHNKLTEAIKLRVDEGANHEH